MWGGGVVLSRSTLQVVIKDIPNANNALLTPLAVERMFGDSAL